MRTRRDKERSPLRPQVTEVSCSTTRLVLTVCGERYVIESNPRADGQTIPVHCDLCGAEWTGQWREDRTPIYTGGLLTARFRQRYYDRRVRREQACRCDAGRRMASLEPASEDTLKLWKRLRKWQEIRTARMIVDGVRPQNSKMAV